MPTLILEDKSEWVVGAPVIAEVERLRAQLKVRHEEWRTAALELVERGAQCDTLRTKLETCSGRYDEVVADRDRMLDSRDELRANLDKAVSCLVCLPIADPVEVCENTLDILMPGWRDADTPKKTDET